MTLSIERIAGLGERAGQVATVRGWVTHVRSSGKVAFVVVRDGTGVMQGVVVKNQVSPEVWDRFSTLTLETSLALTGEVRSDARSPGGVEMGVESIEIIGSSPSDYPIQP